MLDINKITMCDSCETLPAYGDVAICYSPQTPCGNCGGHRSTNICAFCLFKLSRLTRETYMRFVD